MQQTGLARIIVIAPHRRVEMAVPEHVPLAAILPTLLRQAGPTLAEDGVDHGGWLLRRIDGRRLDNARSLAMQDVLDGETLVLSLNDAHWPEPAFDDVAEAIADDAARRGGTWSGPTTVQAGRALAAVALAAGPVLLLTGAASWQAGALAFAGAGALLATAVTLDRITRDGPGTQLTGGFALLYAAVGALVLGADGPDAMLTPWPVAGAAAALLLASAVGQLLLPGIAFIAGGCTAVGMGAAALLAATATTVEGAAAAVAGLFVLLLFALPRLAMAGGGVPAPPVPSITGEVEEPPLPAGTLADAVRRTDVLLTGLLWGAAVVLAACAGTLARSHSAGALALVAVTALVCALRARAFAAVRQRTPLIAAAAAGVLGLTWYAWTGPLRTPAGSGLLVAALLAAALLSLAASRRLARRAVTPRLGRLADIVSLVGTAAVPLLVALVLGLFGFMRGLAG